MPIYDAILPHAGPFLLVLSRIAGLFFFAPLLSSRSIPTQVKVMVALALTAAVYPLVPSPAPWPPVFDLVTVGALFASEALIGLTIGILAAVPLMCVQLGGLMMGTQMGLGIAQTLNPATDISGDNIGQMLFYLTLAAFLTVGGLELIVGAVLVTFERVPLGGLGPRDMPIDLLVGLLTSGFAMAMRIALPVLMIIFLESIAMGFLMKTVPSLNIMSFGFPLRVLVGLFTLVAALDFISSTIADELGRAVEAWTGWAMNL